LLRIGCSRETSDVLFVRSARLAVVFAVLGGAAVAASGLGAAFVTRQADRDVSFSPGADCDLDTIEALASRHPGARQFVLMATTDFDDTAGTVEVAARDIAGVWRCQQAPMPARFGRNGTRPLFERRSGDGTTPAGVFPLGLVTAWDGQQFSIFGNRPNPGVLVPYRDVRPEDCWGATANTSRYQHLVDRARCPGPADEWLAGITGAYSHAAVIGANLDPISGDEPGETPYAAAIFLHRFSYDAAGASRPTSGCVSLEYVDLVDTLRLLDHRLAPHFAIGPIDWLRNSV
jgi:L,D-peptidoglycan transpeptidase YkuD (ErfK/YbiS/YcfS/YnhG family)